MRESGTTIIAALVIIVLIAAFLSISPHLSPFLLRTGGVARLERKLNSVLTLQAAMLAESTSRPSGISSTKSHVQRGSILRTSLVTAFEPEGSRGVIDLERSRLQQASCPPNLLMQESLPTSHGKSALSAVTCLFGSFIEVAQSGEFLSNLSGGRLGLTSYSPAKILIAGSLSLASLEVFGQWTIIVGGDVSIDELIVSEGGDLRLHSATGKVEVQSAQGLGLLLISNRDQASNYGLEESRLIVPMSTYRLMGIETREIDS